MYFRKAQPVWLADCAQEMNVTGGFRAEITIQDGQPVTLTMAASTFYHVYLDGKPFMFGPTRCAHGFFRVDEWRLDERLLPGTHWLAVEVLGYHINGFDTLDQPVFLQLEVRQNETPVVWTDDAGTTVTAFRLRDRVQKVQRYDFQRSFAECYHLRADYGQWRCGGGQEAVSALENASSGTLLSRDLPSYTFPEVAPAEEIAVGTVTRAPEPWTFTADRSVKLVGSVLKGFREEEMELYVSKELEGFRCRSTALTGTPYDRAAALPVKDGTYRLLSMSCIKTGFLCMTVSCTAPVCVYALYDEVLVEGDILPYRQRAVNAIRLELEPGRYVFQSADPVDFKYLKIAALGGDCIVSDMYLRELACPLTIQKKYTGTDSVLGAIYQAAVETFRQNSPDIFVDCPSRERGGWLCDSYFTAQTEYLLTGENRIEKLFLENFLLPAAFPDVPEGMLPMCYPADHYDHAFIPNWAMWFILELKKYLDRTGDRAFIDRARERVYGIVEYFCPFFNEDGLLEKLDGWIFVEWSAAAELVQDVNYPTNMLYAAALMAAGELYDDAALRRQAGQMREMIRRQSFNGGWFVDNAVRQDGKLVPGTKSTEVCQYYAFFFDVATPEQYPVLWERLKTAFVPSRDTAAVYPEIAPINVLPGVSLRLSLLDRYGCGEQLLREIKERLTYMVEETGTLWENKESSASCVHGFISFVSVLIDRNDPTMFISVVKPGKLSPSADLRREEFDRENERILRAGEKVDVVFLGDSITEGWDVRSTFADLGNVYNRGIGGDVIDCMAKRLEADVLQLKPLLAVIQGGVNNTFSLFETAEADRAGQEEAIMKTFTAAWMSILTACRKAGQRLAVCALTPLSEQPDPGALARKDMVVRMNRWLQTFCLQNRLPFIDYHTSLAEFDGKTAQPCLTRDGLHPNSWGYARMERVIRPVLTSVLAR